MKDWPPADAPQTINPIRIAFTGAHNAAQIKPLAWYIHRQYGLPICPVVNNEIAREWGFESADHADAAWSTIYDAKLDNRQSPIAAARAAFMHDGMPWPADSVGLRVRLEAQRRQIAWEAAHQTTGFVVTQTPLDHLIDAIMFAPAAVTPEQYAAAINHTRYDLLICLTDNTANKDWPIRQALHAAILTQFLPGYPDAFARVGGEAHEIQQKIDALILRAARVR